MARNPSVHITLSNLSKTLKKIGIVDPEELAKKILVESQEYAISDRVIVRVRKSTAKKIVRKSSLNKRTVDTFQGVLNGYRQLTLKHGVVRAITETSKQYSSLQDVTALAINFCDTFQLTQLVGFQEFVEIGVDLIGPKFGLNKFAYREQQIHTLYQARLELDNDPHPETTKSVYQYYATKLGEHGIAYKIDRGDYETLHHFYLAKDALLSVDASVTDWVDAQFAEMEFLQVMPEPNQLYTKASKDRYRKWRMSKAATKPKSKRRFQTEAEEAYYNRMK